MIFREVDDKDEVIWEKEAEIIDVHHQYAIVCKTPPFRNGSLDNCHAKTVHVVLQRRNSKESGKESPRYVFQYNNYTDDNDYVEHKRKKARASGGQSTSGTAAPPAAAPLNYPTQQQTAPMQPTFAPFPQQNVQVLVPYNGIMFPPHAQPQLVFNPNQGMPQAAAAQAFSHPQPETAFSTINVNALDLVETDRAQPRYVVKLEEEVKPYLSPYNDMYGDMYSGNGNFTARFPMKREPQTCKEEFTEKAMIGKMQNLNLTEKAVRSAPMPPKPVPTRPPHCGPDQPRIQT